MAENTFKLEIAGQAKDLNLKVVKPEFVQGRWTSDKEGKNSLKKSNLGDTVYFHIDTKGLNGAEVELSLAEFDYNNTGYLLGAPLFRDIIDPDDREFPEEEVIKKAIVHNDRAYVELILNEDWEGMIKDDSDNAFSLNTSLELYWEAKYGNLKKELPIEEDEYLLVGFSDRTLYFKPPIATTNLPEFFTYDGDPMLLMEFAKGFGGDQINDKILDFAAKNAKKNIQRIAFAKLKKGHLVDNQGKVYTGKRLVYEYKQIFSNSGEIFENVKMGQNFGYKFQNQQLKTTKGISQYDYFSKKGKSVTLLGMVKNLGNVFDLFNISKTAVEDLDTNDPLPIDFGPLSPIADLAGVLVQEQKAEMDFWMEEAIQSEVDQAKLLGLEATKKAINSWNHNDEYKWSLMAISNEIANKVLQGEFKKFKDLETQVLSQGDFLNLNIQMLYREIYNEAREDYIYIIETLFING